MALKACRECKKQVSASAKICPGCGVAAPIRKKGAGMTGVILGVLALGYCTSRLKDAYDSDTAWNTSHPGMVRADARTGRPPLRHDIQIYAIRGAVLCPTEEELNVFQRGAPNACTRLRQPHPVSVVEMKGFLLPTYKVRMQDGYGLSEAWMSMSDLANEPNPPVPVAGGEPVRPISTNN